MDSLGEEKVGYIERVAWKHRHYRKIDSQWERALRELKSGLCDNLEGWDGVEGGRKAQEGGGMCIPVADSC